MPPFGRVERGLDTSATLSQTMAPDAQPASSRKPFRTSFKNAARKSSVIVPFTAERVHVGDYGTTGRTFTIRPSSSDTDGGLSTDTTPLLDRRTGISSVGQYASRNNEERGLDYSDDDTRWGWLIKLVRELLAKENTKKILKCTLAYFLGSLATFVTPIAAILGKNDGKHMVATIAVYFHPARTVGSMVEATIWAFTAMFYSIFVSLASMATACFFGDHEMLGLGHALVLIIFCGGGLGFIGWCKQKMASPIVGVAASLSSIFIITVLTKEGFVQRAEFSMNKITQVTLMVFMAIACSALIAFTVWPTSARDQLRMSMVKSTGSFSGMLSLITNSFITGSEEDLKRSTYITAAANHRSVFTALNKQLAEAKLEHYVRGTETQYVMDRKLVDCMQKLAQHIGGLQSASQSQLNLLQQHANESTGRTTAINTPLTAARHFTTTGTFYTPPASALSPFATHSPPTPNAEIPTLGAVLEESAEGDANPVTIFEQFIFHLGPPMKSLVYTLKIMLDNLPAEPSSDRNNPIAVNPRFRESLVKAIELYSEARAEALDALYKNLKVITGSRDRREEWAADVEEVAGCCGYFSYCLQEFAQEMIVFLNILEQMEAYQEWPTRSWSWLKFWKKEESLSSGSSGVITAQPDILKLPDPSKTIPNVARDQPIPFTYKIWKMLRIFRRDDIKFGIKVGGGAALYALPAFIDSTRPIFAHWRGEWGLVSYMIVMSMTIGQTNTSGLLRVLGTIIGAILAVIAWIVFPENPYALSLFGCVIAMPCFHIILNWKQSTFGRFILLTYNLSCLYAYSLSVKDDDDDDDEGGINPIITDIAFHRVVSVIIGVAWGVFVNQYIWPISARTKLRKGLSVLWLRMALIWKRDPLLLTIGGQVEKQYMSIKEERALQSALLRLSSLIAQAPNEFRLKGPFPVGEYQKIIAANQSILDACHGLSMMISKDPQANAREADILNYTEAERKDLCARISHLFYVLASSIKLGFPLPETLPNTDRARDRFLAKVFAYREKIRGEEGKSDEDFAMTYAYILVIGTINQGLQELIDSLGRLYGVLEEEMLEI
ncbi:Fusaric acid resistance protein-like-domain-containing protein [Peziza echinospora]|nr:Fusaric acid resistance protein-like-domain-containing protein [Peziza echinospora]